MHKFKALLKLNFQGMFHLFNGKGGGSGKKGARSGKFTLVIMVAISLYISGIYSFMLGSTYASAGVLELLPAVMSVIICLFSLLFTAFGASGIVFGGKDMDLMLSLPVSSFQIMLSKVLALYLENLMLCILMMLPCGVSYIRYGGDWGIYFLIALPVLTIFFAIIPTVLSLIVGYLLALLNGKFGSNALINNLAYLLFFCVVFFFSFRLNGLMIASAAQADGIRNVFQTWLIPLWLFISGLLGNIGSALLFIAVTSVPFLLIVYLFSRKYKLILSSMTARAARADYKMHSLKAKGPFKALFFKELQRYWGTPAYLFNVAFGIIIAPAACVFGVIKREVVWSALAQMEGIPTLVLICGIAGFIFVSTCPTAVSISLEGKNFWILKEAPISSNTLLLAKGLANALLIWGCSVICIPMLIYILRLSAVEAVILTLLCLATGIFVPAAGLWLNLLFPKLDGSNDTLVVKQSLSTMLATFGGWGVVALGALAYYLFGKYMPDAVFTLGCGIVVLAVGGILWMLLAKKGAARLLQL